MMFVVCVLLLLGLVKSQVTFTGDAVFDFFPDRLSSEAQKAYLEIYHGPSNLGPLDQRMRTCRNLTTGWDVESVIMQYDFHLDILYVGVNCYSACGDPDGDGSEASSGSTTISFPSTCLGPNGATNVNIVDYSNYALTEALSLVFWPEPPLTPQDYENLGNLTLASTVFYPTFIVGIPSIGTSQCRTAYKIYTDLDAYIFQEDAQCVGLSFPFPAGSTCANLHADRIKQPTSAFGVKLTSATNNAAAYPLWFGRSIPPLTRFVNLPAGYQQCNCSASSGCYRQAPFKLPMYPNITMPDIEFSLSAFSHYANFSFQPGIEPIKFAFMLYTGRTGDEFGEEIIFPSLFSIPCTIQDACGECAGDNSTCKDCFGVVLGTAKYDRCGVCNGLDACVDCANITNGVTAYDRCGVCNGTNACVDCADEVRGTAEYDRCGVCKGNNSCVDCFDVPNGGVTYDRCGVCNGTNACVDCLNRPNGGASYDLCGVCNGTNACLDCAGIPNGPTQRDRCNVCNGTDACVDCAGVVNGTAVYDRCGICNGGDRCVDCLNVVNGTATYDRCGVCNGLNSCVDCLGEPDGGREYDLCGICDGGNECVDCLGHPNGGAVFDLCNICNGTNACLDCKGQPRGGAAYDRCGVCEGKDDCLDCAGLVDGVTKYDLCGVCGGNSSTCLDCLGQALGTAKYDVCGVCAGNGSTCLDCLGIPNGHAVVDICGNCDGGCITGTVIIDAAEDSYIELANRTQNFGRDQDLEVRNNKTRTVVQFEQVRERLFKCKNSVLINASIEFYIRGIITPSDGWVDPAIDLHTLNHTFCQKYVSWDCRDQDETGCCVPWSMLSLPPKIKPDYNLTPLGTRNITSQMTGWLSFDITQHLIDFRDHSNTESLAYLLKKSCETDFGRIDFWSCEGHRCPRLVVNMVSTCPVTTIEPPCEIA